MADPHIQMGEVLKEAREKMEGPRWSYPKREDYFDAPAPTAHGIRSVQAASYRQEAEAAAQQGALAPALRTVSGYLTYVVTFAAGWFTSAVYSLGKMKGWW